MDSNVVKIPSLTWFVENSGRYSSVKSSPKSSCCSCFFYPKARLWFTLIAEAIMKSTGKLRKEGRGENARVFFAPLPLPYFKPSTSPLKSFFRLAKSLCQFQRPNRSQNTPALQVTKSPNFNRRLYRKGRFVPLAPRPSPPHPFLPSIRTSVKFSDFAEQNLPTLLMITFKLKFPNFQFGKWSLS